MYQVEALCSRAIWIDKGKLRLQGPAAEVTSAYSASLASGAAFASQSASYAPPAQMRTAVPEGTGRIVRAVARTEFEEGRQVHVHSSETDVAITIEFAIDPSLPVPGVALGFSDATGLTVASAGSVNDGVTLRMDSEGRGQATILFRRLPLLKGRYSVTCFLTTEDGVHPYDQVEQCLQLQVTQHGLEQGVVTLPHEWQA